MIAYEDVQTLMNRLPGHLPGSISIFDYRQLKEGRFLAHPAMTELLYFVMENPDPGNDSARAVVDLVSDLYENGDDRCKNLVIVSFIEGLVNSPEDVFERVQLLFNASMREVLSDEYRMLQ